MIIDLNAWAGSWGTSLTTGEAGRVVASLAEVGVDRVYLSPLAAAWSHNPHLCNELVYQAALDLPAVSPVPVIDPTIPTWRAELNRARRTPGAWWVRLLPTYARYSLEQADELLAALAQAGMGAIVQVRIEDPRRQHPLAQVADYPAKAVAEAAARHPGLPVIIGGAGYAALAELKVRFLDLPNLYADTSQVDGLDSLKWLVEQGLGDRLVFGTHAPLLILLAGLARVVNDLDEAAAWPILSGNARRIMGN